MWRTRPITSTLQFSAMYLNSQVHFHGALELLNLIASEFLIQIIFVQSLIQNGKNPFENRARFRNSKNSFRFMPGYPENLQMLFLENFDVYYMYLCYHVSSLLGYFVVGFSILAAKINFTFGLLFFLQKPLVLIKYHEHVRFNKTGLDHNPVYYSRLRPFTVKLFT